MLHPVTTFTAVCVVFALAACAPSTTDAGDGTPEICPAITDAFGFGIHVESQCASSTSYSGAGVVIDVMSSVAGSTDYYVTLSEQQEREGGCQYPPRLRIATNQLSPVLPLVAQQRVRVELQTETSLETRALYIYALITDAHSGELLFAHYHWDDRLFTHGHFVIPGHFDF